MYVAKCICKKIVTIIARATRLLLVHRQTTVDNCPVDQALLFAKSSSASVDLQVQPGDVNSVVRVPSGPISCAATIRAFPQWLSGDKLSVEVIRQRRYTVQATMKRFVYLLWCPERRFIYRTRIRYDTRCYFNVRSKADTSRLNLPHGEDN